MKVFQRRASLACALLMLFGAVACHSQASAPESTDVSPVSGQSLLARLGLTVDSSQLGRVGGMDEAPATGRREPLPEPPGVWRRLLRPFSQSTDATEEPFTLAGEDLYRLNCQSCHGPDGAGAPPEINSLLDPIQGTSAALLKSRLEAAGRPIDEAFIQEIAAGAEQDLRKRLADGGEKMPPFNDLNANETDALVGYLKQLAKLPEASSDRPMLTVPVLRVGEQVVKGTCHICHDASGPDRGRMAVMMSGETPPLSSLTRDYSIAEVVAKVREGRSGMGGMMMMMRESKMPRLPYLTPEEVTAAMLYLMAS
jgi:mono/diheme cytochrome c family protein